MRVLCQRRGQLPPSQPFCSAPQQRLRASVDAAFLVLGNFAGFYQRIYTVAETSHAQSDYHDSALSFAQYNFLIHSSQFSVHFQP